ncbi:hypothetical protein ACJMK2_041668, partial [Sinanodonta woodiana]
MQFSSLKADGVKQADFFWSSDASLVRAGHNREYSHTGASRKPHLGFSMNTTIQFVE